MVSTSAPASGAKQRQQQDYDAHSKMLDERRADWDLSNATSRDQQVVVPRVASTQELEKGAASRTLLKEKSRRRIAASSEAKERVSRDEYLEHSKKLKEESTTKAAPSIISHLGRIPKIKKPETEKKMQDYSFR